MQFSIAEAATNIEAAQVNSNLFRNLEHISCISIVLCRSFFFFFCKKFLNNIFWAQLSDCECGTANDDECGSIKR